jgi:putative membrane protein
MNEFVSEYYLYIKAFHLIAVISWMAGLLYLPRLYVYHCGVEVGSEMDRTFKIMEYRLLRFIMNPAMITSLILGIIMIYSVGLNNFGKWLHAKLFVLLLLFAAHGLMAKIRKEFAEGKNKRTHIYFRVLNEVPTVCMIIIVILAVVKPF